MRYDQLRFAGIFPMVISSCLQWPLYSSGVKNLSHHLKYHDFDYPLFKFCRFAKKKESRNLLQASKDSDTKRNTLMLSKQNECLSLSRGRQIVSWYSAIYRSWLKGDGCEGLSYLSKIGPRSYITELTIHESKTFFDIFIHNQSLGITQAQGGSQWWNPLESFQHQ